MKARKELPNDTVELKGLVYQLLDVVEEQKKLIANQNERIETQFQKIEEQSQKIEEQSQRIDQLTDQVNSLKRYRYGKKSEKVKKEKVEPDNQQETQETSPDANRHRMTLHHCLGSVVPSDIMGFGIPFGSLFDARVQKHMQLRPYVYMAPWYTFENQIVGGLPWDIFTFSDHVYGRDSVVFVPKSEAEKFTEENQGFEGTCVFYDPAEEKLPDLVSQILEQRGAWRTSFETVDREPTKKKTFINGHEIDQEQLMRLLSGKVPYVGLHQKSLFRGLESLLEWFTRPFLCKTKYERVFLPIAHERALKDLVFCVFQLLEEELDTPLSRWFIDSLSQWKKSLSLWLDLYMNVHGALLNGRIIEGEETLKKLKLLRYNIDEVRAFLDTLPLKEQQVEDVPIDGYSTRAPHLAAFLRKAGASAKSYEMSSDQFQVSIPEYLEALRGLSPDSLRKISERLQASKTTAPGLINAINQLRFD